ncbi:MAG: hypothetical protein JNK57_00435 [Planctomycetaceae bacterium]|nr:hypothetical protein [Planctomycetaceae bacterium]
MKTSSTGQSLFELPRLLKLTPFEHFQYWETQDGFPNQIVATLDFVGFFDAAVFVAAVVRTLPRHPLLFSRIKVAGEAPVAFVWTEGQPRFALDPEAADANIDPAQDPQSQLERFGLQDYVRLQVQADGWQPQQLDDLPEVHPARGASFRLTIQFNRTHCRWIMQSHHAVCDGVGGLQSIRELLQVYHWLSTESKEPFPLRPMQMERLQNRGRLMRGTASWVSRLGTLPMKWIGLFGASKFLWRRPVSLCPTRPQSNLAPAKLAWVDGRLTASQSQRLRQIAKEFGVTVNSLLLAHWLATLHRFRCQNGRTSDGSRECYRLMIPTNERTGGDVALSACNQVSMVYVDRWSHEMEHIDGLAAGIDFEMSVIRRWGLSGTFLLALKVLSWFPGLIRRYARRPSCWATSYVTNLGPILERLRVGRSGPFSQVGKLTLADIRLLPPLRPSLPAALAVHLYAGQLCLTLHYDPGEIPTEQSAELMRAMLNRLRTQ